MPDSSKATILVVDDEKSTREGLGESLRLSYNVFMAESMLSAIAILEREPVDLILSDLNMPGGTGLELIRTVRARFPGVVCILLTAYGTMENSVEALRIGAHDFLCKPVDLDEVEERINHHLAGRQLACASRAVSVPDVGDMGLLDIVGRSPAMMSVYEIIRRAAPTQATVLVQGPSGSGKELVARALHKLSARASGPFVAVHCAALSATLLESELFGHEKGAFTGADRQHIGRFEQANGGTIFLDEISEIDLSVQVKLLRVLETRSFERVGGSHTISTNIRIIAATNRDLMDYVRQGKFREDLYYRLDIVEIRMPTLAQRTDDIPRLCSKFITEFAEQNGRSIAGIDPAAMQILQSYGWPGNVRELRNTIERMVVLSSSNTLMVEDIPSSIRTSVASVEDVPAAIPIATPVAAESLAEAEKRKILDALAAHGGNVTHAADMLGVSRRTLQRKLKTWGVRD